MILKNTRILPVLALVLLVILAACAPAEEATSTPEPTDVPVETAEAEAATEEVVVTEEVVAKIIEKENIDAILPTMGGQTALNVATSMYDKGMLEGIQ
ncbi:MAG: hypothetical protein ACPG7F_14890, partial [Aggregatilineales bacterium]